MSSSKRGEKMKRNTIIIVTVIAILAVLFGAASYLSAERVPKNPASASGNLAGNLYNGGYFCEYEGEVFYSNASDNYHLYRIEKDGSIKKENYTAVFSLNIYNGYLYYSKNSTKAGNHAYLSGRPYGIYRINLKDSKVKCLTTTLCPYITLCGNDIVLQEYTNTNLYFSKIQIDKEGGMVRISDTGYPVACSEGGFVYYAEQNKNHNVYRYNPESNSTSLVYAGNCYQPVCIGNILYFIDVEDGYRLKRALLPNGETQTISSEHCVNYNTDGDVIYFEVENSPSGAFGLYRCNIDGSDLVQISDQACKNINITSSYTYFQYFANDFVWYRLPKQGEVQIEAFDVVYD